MAVDILMPNLGFDTQTGRLIEWLKQPGDPVSKGEPIAVIESDKANVELEALASGVLIEQLAQADQEVAIGAVIGRIGAAGSAVVPTAVPTPTPAPAEPPTRISPVARRMAQELAMPVGQIVGSGDRGRVTRRDVEAFQRQQTQAAPASAVDAEPGADAHGIRALPNVRRAARARGIDLQAVRAAGYPNPITLATLDAFSAAPSPDAATAAPAPAAAVVREGAALVPLSRMRQTIGRRLSESMREAPHFYVTAEFVFDAALAQLAALGGKAKVNDLIAYLTVQTLLAVPALNATFTEGSLYRYDGVHLALAVARDDGLITPVLHHAERFSLTGLAGELRALISRARANRLTADDLQGGTFTISNMGMIAQVEQFTAVINPPQVGIVAVGALKPRPVVIDGGLFIRQTAHMTLSGDHRAVDGMDLARFMAAFQTELDRFAGT